MIQSYSPCLVLLGNFLLLLLLGTYHAIADSTQQPVPTSSSDVYIQPFTSSYFSTEEAPTVDVVCPSQCECDKTLQQISCNNASLVEVPNPLPPQVQYLSLQDNHLTALTMHVFNNLKQLTVLDLSSNYIVTIDQDTFANTPKLQEINLHNNLLNESCLSGLSGVLQGELKVLNVSNNRIRELDISGSALQVLDAGYNQITTFISTLHQLSSLYKLILKHNNIHQLNYPSTSSSSNSSSNISSFNSTLLSLYNNTSTLTELDLSANNLTFVEDSFFTNFPLLHVLDLSHNHLDKLESTWGNSTSPACNSLWYMDLSYNAFTHLPNDMFAGCCPNLTVLHVSNLGKLTHINSRSFAGLPDLYSLSLQYNPQLNYIHASAFAGLQSLSHLNLSFTSITSLHSTTFASLQQQHLISLDLTSVALICSCETTWLQHWDLLNTTALIPHNLSCHMMEDKQLIPVSDFPEMNCSAANVLTKPISTHVSYEIGSTARFDCLVAGQPDPYVTWIASKSKHKFTYHPAYIDHSELLEPSHVEFHADHYWHASTAYFHDIPLSERVFVLKNGSLYIDYITRQDAGEYKCIAMNHLGNESLVMTVTLNYHAILETQIWCLVIGLGSAISFLLLGLAAGLIRWAAHFCSPSEKEKRRSIRELLATIQEYKTEKVDVFRAYKTAKLDKISAFKNHKIDKLRLYKQGTVTNILTYMHNMREHYHGQMGKVKDNCNDQVNRLRDNYSNHINKIKDYRAEKVERIRDNYQAQALKIRDYGSVQMQRLREQYKLQQQYMLKLLELLDIGNCMSVIEAECMRTESMLFDPGLTFDLDDTNPVHVPLPPPPCPPSSNRAIMASSDDSEYITAGSLSDVSALDNQTLDTSTSWKSKRHDQEKRRSSSDHSDCGSTSSSSSSSFLDHSILTANLAPEIQDILRDTCSWSHHKSHRRHRKKRKRNHSAQCHSSPPWMGDDERDKEDFTDCKQAEKQQQKCEEKDQATIAPQMREEISRENEDDDDDEAKEQCAVVIDDGGEFTQAETIV